MLRASVLLTATVGSQEALLQQAVSMDLGCCFVFVFVFLTVIGRGSNRQ